MRLAALQRVAVVVVRLDKYLANVVPQVFPFCLLISVGKWSQWPWLFLSRSESLDHQRTLQVLLSVNQHWVTAPVFL